MQGRGKDRDKLNCLITAGICASTQLVSAARRRVNEDRARHISQHSDYDVSLQHPYTFSRALALYTGLCAFTGARAVRDRNRNRCRR